MADKADLEPQFQGSRDMIKTTVRMDAYMWQLGKDLCDKLGLSTCFVLNNLWRAWVTGEIRDIPKARPITLNMKVYYGVERPRRYPRLEPSPANRWPPNCPDSDDFLKSTKEVGCLRNRTWIKLEKCWDCFLAKEVI